MISFKKSKKKIHQSIVESNKGAIFVSRNKQTHRVMKAAARQTNRKAPNGDIYSIIPTDWGWFVRGTDGYNSSDGGDYFATKAQAMKCATRAFAVIRLEMSYEL